MRLQFKNFKYEAKIAAICKMFDDVVVILAYMDVGNERENGTEALDS